MAGHGPNLLSLLSADPPGGLTDGQVFLQDAGLQR